MHGERGRSDQRPLHGLFSCCKLLFSGLLHPAAAREHVLADALAGAQRLREMEDSPDGEGSPAEGNDRPPASPAPALRQGAAATAGACARVTILGADTEVRDCVFWPEELSMS